MELLDITPLLSSILGFLLSVFILSRTSGLGSDKKIRLVLAGIIFLYAYTAFDYYLSLKLDINSIFSGSSYLFYHLSGPLFYYFIALFTKTNIHLKRWLVFLSGYTLIRWILFLPMLQYENLHEIMASASEYGTWFWIELEYVVATILNIATLLLSYSTLKNAPLALVLNKTQQMHYQWTKALILLFIMLQIASAFNTVLHTNQLDTFEFFVHIETLLLSVFFFALAYSLMHLPVFAFTGAFEDLPDTSKKKYAKSSLSDSSKLFQLIEKHMREEQLYLDFDIKLNTLADQLNKSVHHISQAINENAQVGFSDYINQFRIEAAKKKLLEPKPDTIHAISLDVGFNSKAVFYTAFKKNVHMTPTEFKKLHNSN